MDRPERCLKAICTTLLLDFSLVFVVLFTSEKWLLPISNVNRVFYTILGSTGVIFMLLQSTLAFVASRRYRVDLFWSLITTFAFICVAFIAKQAHTTP